MKQKDLRQRPATSDADEPSDEPTERHFIDVRDLRSPSNQIVAPEMGEIEILLRLAVLLSRGKAAEA